MNTQPPQGRLRLATHLPGSEPAEGQALLKQQANLIRQSSRPAFTGHALCGRPKALSRSVDYFLVRREPTRPDIHSKRRTIQESTLGQASRLAEMTQLAFQALLAERQIPIHYGVEEFREDLRNLRQVRL